MMQQRRGNTMTSGQKAGFALLGLCVIIIGVLDAGIYGGSMLSGDGQKLPANPFGTPFLLVGGKVGWSGSSTVVAAATAVLILVLALLVLLLVVRSRKGRTRVDHKATLMGRGKDIAQITEKSVAASAARFGVQGSIGAFIGITVAGAQKVYADFESVVLQIWGPRQGKSSTQVIPRILDAPGAVATTSNKPDVIDATRLARSVKGQVWAFDPQMISGDAATWWWNPLSYVRNDERAMKLAEIFMVAGRGPNVTGDAYFDNEGKDMLTSLFLAAAIGNKPISVVYDWINQGKPTEPSRLLREQENGIYAAYAASLEAQLQYEPAQRDGVVGTAKAMVQTLKFVSTLQWVNPLSASDSRPQFGPEEFVRSAKDTLYVLSKEGGGSAAALTTALTVAVADAAEEYAMTQPGRRLAVPLLMPLDEIANVCPWKDLPDKYSHYGSKGIIPEAYLQSYSQGEELWGEKGMRKIYSASSVKVIGSGIDEEGFLRQFSSLVGEYTYDTISRSSSKTGQSRSVNPDAGKESILSVADLSALPIGRAVVKRSGAPATMIKTQQWKDGRHADSVWLSLNIYDPSEKSKEMTAAILERKDADTNPVVVAYKAQAPAPTLAVQASRWITAAGNE
ncbi:type IV secretory system conjugative DNA transfer family protein [Arthrobacter sp. Soil736]|uniref:type IV secretory system conjugative DNA transfer family protein n=1 Tax=Arthrobacter sp. Soil736 TaxID=1736395 RepID=UPI0009E8BE98|nr:type IV secretory system conjugative DNA transfer family protein [Arthrobacter sp. Soil736]